MKRVLPLLFMLLFAFPAFGQQLSGGGGGGGGSGGATSANQTNASQKTQIVDGSGNVIAATSNNLNVQCANCSGSGASAADGASFTAGMSVFAPSGCFYQTTATSNALTTGLQGFAQCTAQRAWFTNLRNASGAEVGTASTPLQVSIANTGANSTAVLVNQPTAANLNVTAVGTGTFSTQSAITASSGSIASGAVASGAYASGSISDGAEVTLGAKADARSTATDTTPISAMSVLKQISASVQAPPSQAVTNAGTFATQSAITAASGAIANGADVALGSTTDAKNAATDTTAVTGISILKEISSILQSAVITTGTQTAPSATVLSVVPLPNSGSAAGIAPVASSAAESCHVLKASAGNLYGVSGYVGAATFVMVFNATTAPADGAVTPVVWAYIPAAGSWSIAYGTIPATFSTGITVCDSSTRPLTKTAVSTNNVFSGYVQ